MKVLFIFDDGPNSTFYLYDLSENQRLWQVSPEVPLNRVPLGELYSSTPIDKFLQYFSVAFGVPVTKYLVVTKAEGLDAVKEAGLDATGKMSVTNETAFTSSRTGQHFAQGELQLTLAEVADFIHYQIDDDGQIGVFTRQEDLIRLMKWKTVKPSLSSITKNFGTVKDHTNSNLGLKDMLKLGSGYLAKGNARMNKIAIPAPGTFQVLGDFPYQLGKINWAQNPIKLAPELRGDAD